MDFLESLVKGNTATGLAVGIGAYLLAPVLLPAVARVGRPVAKTAIKGGIIAYDRGRDLVTGVGRGLGDLVADTGGAAAATAGAIGRAARPTQRIELPPADSVDIRGEVGTIRGILTRSDYPDRPKVENAVTDAEYELTKPEPDRNEVGTALQRALGYAHRAEGFAAAEDELAPHIAAAVSWLGRNWHDLLASVGRRA